MFGRSAEAGNAAGQHAAVPEGDRQRACEIARGLAIRNRYRDPPRKRADIRVIHGVSLERAGITRVAIDGERDAEWNAVLREHDVCRRRDVVDLGHALIADDSY